MQQYSLEFAFLLLDDLLNVVKKSLPCWGGMLHPFNTHEKDTHLAFLLARSFFRIAMYFSALSFSGFIASIFSKYSIAAV